MGASNARDAYFGPEMPLYGLAGFALALSAHRLWRELRAYARRRINEFNDGEEAEEVDRERRRNLKGVIGRFALNAYDAAMSAFLGWKLWSVSRAYYLQNKE